MKQRHAPLVPQIGPGEDSVIDSLPEEILARVLGLLQPCQLHWVERVNTRLRNTAVHNNLWRAHCIRVCHNFEAVVASVDAESLRQVLVDLRGLADADTPCNTSNNSPPRRLGFSLVPFPSHSKPSSLPCGSPVLRSDSELTRSSPGAQVAPFWGPGLAPASSAGTELLPSSGTTSQSPGVSIISRLHRLCTGQGQGQRNLSTQGPSKQGTTTSKGSSKLWSFNTDLSEDVITSLFYKRLCWRLGACAAKESLISQALQASSTDRPEEHIRHVLNPSARMRGFMSACYWCSGPSHDVNSVETLDFKLAHPLCVIHEIALQPFKADFQPGSPVYAPRSVRFHFASTLQDLASASQAQSKCTSTPKYPVENSDRLQHFHLPVTLCAGGFVRVELIGRVQRQQEDDCYYTCMLYVKVSGTPVYGFLPSSTQQERTSHLEHQLSPIASPESSQTQFSALQQSDTESEVQQLSGGACQAAQGDEEQKAVSSQQPSVVLKAVLHDPLAEAGGLRRVSEMGRLLLQSSLAVDAASDVDDDDDDLHGDSDDGDFAQEQLEDLVTDDDSDDGNAFDLAHGVGLQMGADLAHVPLHELLGGHIDGVDGDMEEYPLMYE